MKGKLPLYDGDQFFSHRDLHKQNRGSRGLPPEKVFEVVPFRTLEGSFCKAKYILLSSMTNDLFT